MSHFNVSLWGHCDISNIIRLCKWSIKGSCFQSCLLVGLMGKYYKLHHWSIIEVKLQYIDVFNQILISGWWWSLCRRQTLLGITPKSSISDLALNPLQRWIKIMKTPPQLHCKRNNSQTTMRAFRALYGWVNTPLHMHSEYTCMNRALNACNTISMWIV